MIRVCIIWGESPEPGDLPVTYKFATEAEADAFRLGINAAMGWNEGTEVTGPSVRVNRDGEINPERIVNGWSS